MLILHIVCFVEQVDELKDYFKAMYKPVTEDELDAFFVSMRS